MRRLSKIEVKILSRLARQNDLENKDFSVSYQEYLPRLVEQNLVNRTTIIIHNPHGRENRRSGYRITLEGRNALEFSRIEKRNNVRDCILKLFAYLIKCFLSIITRLF